ncbi:cupin domain-containing protein [Enterobacter kobei]|uniref:cupin domain-containing protein n=1 Tax=Enterobacter kobei TaxID=208224 RepID=UPI001ABDC461|nr:cupin domain-containing protein [Enterobacter kobei]MBO4154606.1 cupin domain-containing protein [Enterobacter kobei]UOY68671.1 cupin domain-containing protein [Enterobacter kobei]
MIANCRTIAASFALLVMSAFTSAVGAQEISAAHPEKVTPLFKQAMPNVPGKSLIAVEVSFPPGAAASPHTHPASAFLYAYVLSGEIVSAVNDEKPRVFRAGESWSEAPGARHPVTRNPSKTTAAKLLVVFITNSDEHQLVLPDHK